MIRKLATQTAIYGLGTIVPRFINYLLAPYLTYLALSEYNYGVMSYFYATIPFGVSLVTMGMETGFFRFSGKCEDEESKDKLFSTIWSSHILISLLLFLVVLFSKETIYDLIGQEYNISIIPIVGALVAVDVIMALPFARLREQEKSKRFSMIRGLSVLINVALVIFFYSILPKIADTPLFKHLWVDDFGAGYIFVANLIAGITTLLILFPVYKGVKLRINTKLLYKVFLFSMPLFISGFSGTANDLIDRQLLAAFLPHDIAIQEIGLYSAVIKITAIMVIFTQMYRFAAEPIFLSKLKNEDFKRGNADTMKYFTLVSICIFLGITLFRDMFQYIVSEKFRIGMEIVPILLLSNVFMGIHLNLSFWYKFTDKTYFAIIITGVGLIITVAMNLILIPEIGYYGSAWARLASMLAMVVLSYILNQKFYPIPYDIKRIGEYFAVAGVLFAISYLVEIESLVLRYIVNSILMLIFVIYAIKREQIMLLIKR